MPCLLSQTLYLHLQVPSFWTWGCCRCLFSCIPQLTPDSSCLQVTSDTETLQMLFQNILGLMSSPLRIIGSVALLYQQLGPASLVAVATLVMFMPVQVGFFAARSELHRNVRSLATWWRLSLLSYSRWRMSLLAAQAARACQPGAMATSLVSVPAQSVLHSN